MPGMTGAAFAGQAHVLRPDLPILFMSGYEQLGASGEGWPDPGAQVIGKPFTRAALLARVTQVLAATADAGAGQRPGPPRPPERW
jgi:CheY-like chemotaxis protein